MRTRLDLLGRQFNPLGLLYVAYAVTTLRLRERAPLDTDNAGMPENIGENHGDLQR